MRVHHATRSHRVSWAHVRSPRIKTFKKFPTKDTSQYPWQGEEIRDSLGLKRFGAFMVNQCTVLWCGRNLWVETAHSHLRCFALCGKTTPNKQRAAKPYKMAMNWAQVTQKKQQHAQVYVNTIFFPYSCIYFYVLTTTMNFSYKVFKSFVSLPKYNLFPYSCLYFYVLTTILNFSYNVFKSFVICKTVSNLAVVYALSFSRLCLVQ